MNDDAEPIRAGLQSVLRSLTVLESVALDQPVRVGELAPRLGMTKASVQRSLQTLHLAGWIEPAGGEITRWKLSDHARSVLGNSAGEMGLREAALPVIQELRDRTGETVHLSIPTAGSMMTIIERAESRHELRSSAAIGSSYPMIATASGLAVLAADGSSTTDAESAAGAAGWSDEEVARFLAQARSLGYAVQLGPSREVVSVGAAILGRDAKPVAALAVIVPRSRFDESNGERLGPDVVRAAVAVAARL